MAVFLKVQNLWDVTGRGTAKGGLIASLSEGNTFHQNVGISQS